VVEGEEGGVWEEVVVTYCVDHQYLLPIMSVTRLKIAETIYIPGPPNTLISSLELPPLSLMGMT
jgi:hypothetical protein